MMIMNILSIVLFASLGIRSLALVMAITAGIIIYIKERRK